MLHPYRAAKPLRESLSQLRAVALPVDALEQGKHQGADLKHLAIGPPHQTGAVAVAAAMDVA